MRLYGKEIDRSTIPEWNGDTPPPPEQVNNICSCGDEKWLCNDGRFRCTNIKCNWYSRKAEREVLKFNAEMESEDILFIKALLGKHPEFRLTAEKVFRETKDTEKVRKSLRNENKGVYEGFCRIYYGGKND